MAAHECDVCVGPHDPAIHEATVGIRKWLRQSIADKLRPVVAPTPPQAAEKIEKSENKPKRQPRRRAA
jgi:hypothetical protein